MSASSETTPVVINKQSNAQLRELARQWMLGELPQLDYRNQRAALLAAMSRQNLGGYTPAVSVFDDDDEPTQPKLTAVTDADIAASSSAVSESSSTQSALNGDKESSAQWLIALGGVLVFAVILVALFTL